MCWIVPGLVPSGSEPSPRGCRAGGRQHWGLGGALGLDIRCEGKGEKLEPTFAFLIARPLSAVTRHPVINPHKNRGWQTPGAAFPIQKLSPSPRYPRFPGGKVRKRPQPLQFPQPRISMAFPCPSCPCGWPEAAIMGSSRPWRILESRNWPQSGHSSFPALEKRLVGLLMGFGMTLPHPSPLWSGYNIWGHPKNAT